MTITITTNSTDSMFAFISQQKKAISLAFLFVVFFAGSLFFLFPTETLAIGGSTASTTPPATVVADTSWMGTVGLWVGTRILEIAAMVTGIGGSLLDKAVTELILNMSLYIADGGIGMVIEEIWVIVRDVCNIAFIFGFVYIGISMIINPDSSRAKSFLVQLVISALLINFSLFITKVVIDVSNVFALEVYQLLSTSTTGQSNIGVMFAQQMGISGFYGSIPAAQLAQMSTFGSFAFFIAGALFLLIAGFVFAAAAFMIVVRFVALIFIMIFSPLMFAATLFPQTAQYGKMVSSKLISYAFFAPVFLFLLYISLRILESSTWSVAGDSSFAGTLTQPVPDPMGAGGVFLNFLMATLCLIGSLKIAQSFSIVGSDKAMSMWNSARSKTQGYITSRAKGMATAPVRLAAVHGAGRLGGLTAKGIRKLEEKPKWSAGAITGASLRALGVKDLGEKAEKAKFGTSASIKERKDYSEGLEEARGTDDIVKKGIGAAVGSPEYNSLKRLVAGSSSEKLSKLLKKYKEGTPGRAAIMEHITASQMESIMKAKGEEFSEEDKAKVVNEKRDVTKAVLRQQVLQEHAAKQAAAPKGTTVAPLTPEEIDEQWIKKASSDHLKFLGQGELAQQAGNMKTSQLETINKADWMTDTDKADINVKRKDALFKIVDKKNPATVFGKLKEAEMAKLPKEVLLHPNALQFFTPASLREIAKELSFDDRKPIRDALDRDDIRLRQETRNWYNSPQNNRTF